MASLSGVLQQLRAEQRRAQEQADKLKQAISAIEQLNTKSSPASNGVRPKRTLSAATRRRIAQAQRARWAKARKAGIVRRRVVSPAARRKIAAAQRARWARVRAQNQ